MRDKITIDPCSLLLIETATGDEDMDMDMPGETSAKGMHHQHKAGEII